MTAVKLTVLAMLWAVTLWRLPAALRVAGQRSLWGSFASIATASTLGVPQVMHGVDALTGVHDLATLGKNLLGIVGSAAILDFVISIARPTALRRARPPLTALAAAAMAAMTLLFAATPRPAEADNFFQASTGSVPGTAYCVVFLGCLGFAMVVATWLFWSYSRHAGAAWLRSGLRFLGTGTAFGALYSLFRIVLMLLGLLRVPVGAAAANQAADVIENIAIGLIIVGSSVPALGVLWRSARDWRNLARLQPLWDSLTGAVPDIVLGARPDLGSRVRLHRIVIEIRDAALVLGAYATPEVRDHAHRAAEASGLHGEERAAMAEAVWLRAARTAKLAGAEPAAVRSRGRTTPDRVDLDFDSEVTRLLLLSRAYHALPPEAAIPPQPKGIV